MGTKIRVLKTEICELLLPKNQRYRRDVDLCAQNLIKKKKRIIEMHYDDKAGRYSKKNAFAEEKTYIGGSDACQGDSGGPLTKYQAVKEASGEVNKRAFIIGEEMKKLQLSRTIYLQVLLAEEKVVPSSTSPEFTPK